MLRIFAMREASKGACLPCLTAAGLVHVTSRSHVRLSALAHELLGAGHAGVLADKEQLQPRLVGQQHWMGLPLLASEATLLPKLQHRQFLQLLK